jgi:Leucine-rich repeat (LRR) protein
MEKDSSFILFIRATGSPASAYQWFKNNVLQPDQNKDSLKFSALSFADTGSYYCIAQNSTGKDTSKAFSIVLSVNGLPIIHNNRQIQQKGTNTQDSSLLLYVNVTGAKPFAIQWLKDGKQIENALSDSIKFNKLTSADSGLYVCIVSNQAGSDTSQPLSLQIKCPARIGNQKQILSSGQQLLDSSFVLSIQGIGTKPLITKWFKDGTPLPSVTSDSLKFTKLQLSDNGIYSCTIENMYGKDTSLNFTIHIGGVSKPLIQNSKKIVVSSTPVKDSSLVMSLTMSGTPPFTYNWYKVGTTTPITSTAQFKIVKLSSQDQGTYFCIVSNSLGSDTSEQYLLQIQNQQPVALKPDTIKTTEDATIGSNINLNGTDADGDSLTWYALNGQFKGKLSITQGKITPGIECTYSPDPDSNGIDSISYIVNDGKTASSQVTFFIKIQAVNDAPIITALTNSLIINEDDSITLTLNNFKVKDPDNAYPQAFTLTVFDSTNYTHSNLKIKPLSNFAETLWIPVTVNDGTDNSNRFVFPIKVIPVNDQPTLAVTSPANNTTMEFGAPLQISFTGSDIEGIKNVVIKIDQTPTTITAPASPFTYSNNTLTIPFSDSAVGPHTVTIRLEDSDGAVKEVIANVNITGNYKCDSLSVMKMLEINNASEINRYVGNIGIKENNRITTLTFHNSIIRNISAHIQNLTAVKKISFSFDTLTSISNTIGKLNNLVEITTEPQTKIDSTAMASLYNCRSLKALEIHGSLPITQDIGNLINLEDLYIHYSYSLVYLPRTIGNLAKLKKLHLRQCYELIHIPEEIENLKVLDTLTIYICQKLSSLPTTLGGLQNLKSLTVYATVLENLPGSIVNLQQLTNLSLDYGKLNSLPDSIGNLTNLTELVLSSNHLYNLPNSITKLSKLTTLLLGTNQLESTFPTISSFPNLIYFSVNDNLLTTLPSGLDSSKLTSATFLGGFDHNKLCNTTPYPWETWYLTKIEPSDTEWRSRQDCVP